MPTSPQASALTRAADAAIREDFLRLVARVGLGPDRAAALVEASSGRPFETCRPADLLAVLDEPQAALQRATHPDQEPVCDA
jgi:hypothetical protein